MSDADIDWSIYNKWEMAMSEPRRRGFLKHYDAKAIETRPTDPADLDEYFAAVEDLIEGRDWPHDKLMRVIQSRKPKEPTDD